MVYVALWQAQIVDTSLRVQRSVKERTALKTCRNGCIAFGGSSQFARGELMALPLLPKFTPVRHRGSVSVFRSDYVCHLRHGFQKASGKERCFSRYNLGMVKKRRLVLIDGHSVLFRAFHAYPPLTTSKGELVNAVYGFTSILLNVIAELEPTHLA